MRRVAFALCLLLAAPAVAQRTAVDTARDDIARLETAHLKELLALTDAKNKEILAAYMVASDQRFRAQEQAVAFALQAAEKAVTKAELAAEKRFESVNEFRNQLKDQTGTFITRNELWGWLVALIMMVFSAWSILRRAPTTPPHPAPR